MTASSASRLSLYLAGAYTLLAVYGSLYPFSGWSDSGASPTAFLTAGWPRYTTAFDIAINVAAYVPVGFLWVVALRSKLGWLSPLAALAIGSLLSLSMETLQNFLPSRVPSNLDLGCNVAGTLIGSVIGIGWGAELVDGGRLHALRHRLFLSGVTADRGLLLIWLWLLTQFNPETLLFGNGDLHSLTGLAAPLPYSAETFFRIEAAVVAVNTAAIGLVLSLLVRRYQGRLVLALLMAGLAAKSFAFVLIMNGRDGFAWATDGSLAGLGIGLAAWFVATPLAMPWRRALAALMLLLATSLVNLVPENPYLANTFQTWNPGQFLNFHGLTRLASNLWPFLALPWLMMLKGEQ